jgi:hypothetical protein
MKKYPRLPEKLDARRKLMEEDIIELREERKKGLSYKELAEMFGVSKTACRYHCDDEYKKRKNKRRYELIKKRESWDKEYKEKRQKDKHKYYREGYQKFAERAEWKGKKTYQWKKKRYHSDEEFREKTKKQAREQYRKHNPK